MLTARLTSGTSTQRPAVTLVTVTVVDNSLASGQDTFTVSVQNEAPSATFNVFTITSPASEGSTVTLQGEFNDPGMLDVHTDRHRLGRRFTAYLAADPQGDRSFSASYVYIDDSPSNTARDVYRVQVTIYDDKGERIRPHWAFTWRTYSISLRRTCHWNCRVRRLMKMGRCLLSGLFDDPGVLDTHVVTIDWGDGSPATIVELDANVLSFADIPHMYSDDPADDSELLRDQRWR